MISYVYKNEIAPSMIIKRIRQLFDLEVIEDDDCVWLGNDNLLIAVEMNLTRIMLYDISTNIKMIRRIIMGKDKNER